MFTLYIYIYIHMYVRVCFEYIKKLYWKIIAEQKIYFHILNFTILLIHCN
jgi:hypothetical protein